jgi:hypothetical protein
VSRIPGSNARRAQQRILLSLILSSVHFLCACQRKAPGPAECYAFARQVVGASSRALEEPDVKEAVDDWTVRCLTTPFSRELVNCVDRTRRVRYCLLTHGVRVQNAARSLPRSQFFEPESEKIP